MTAPVNYNTVRQRVCDNLLKRLQAISMLNGYSQDYNYIGEWKKGGLWQDEAPAIVFQDPKDDIKSFNRDKTDWVLHITISIFTKGDSTLTDLRNYITDIYNCVGRDPLMDGLITEMEPTGDSMQNEQDDTVYGDIDIYFDIFYSTKSWDLTKLV